MASREDLESYITRLDDNVSNEEVDGGIWLLSSGENGDCCHRLSFAALLYFQHKRVLKSVDRHFFSCSWTCARGC